MNEWECVQENERIEQVVPEANPIRRRGALISYRLVESLPRIRLGFN